MLRPFEYYKPENFNELFDLIEKNNSKVFAGGTDLFVEIRSGQLRPERVIDLKGIQGLNQIEWDGNFLHIGPLTTITQLKESEIIASNFPVLHSATIDFACYEIRNRATIGGNLANAAPCAQTAPPLIVCDAELLLASRQTERKIKVEEFFRGVGKTELKPGEIIKKIILPKLPDSAKGISYKISRTRGMDLPSINVSILILNPADDESREIKICAGSVATTPKRIEQAESKLSHRKLTNEIIAEAKKILADSISPRESSLRSKPFYKKELLGVLVEKALKEFHLL